MADLHQVCGIGHDLVDVLGRLRNFIDRRVGFAVLDPGHRLAKLLRGDVLQEAESE
jgi:hypothetical protein